MEKEILNYLGYGFLLAPFALILVIIVIYIICFVVKVGYAAIKDLFNEDHGPFTVTPKTPSPQPPNKSDGHFIDDPMAVVNVKPDFKGIGDMPSEKDVDDLLKEMRGCGCINDNRDELLIEQLTRILNNYTIHSDGVYYTMNDIWGSGFKFIKREGKKKDEA